MHLLFTLWKQQFIMSETFCLIIVKMRIAYDDSKLSLLAAGKQND
jgi:hypothetical protein